jgi:signal transduction histidine kinase
MSRGVLPREQVWLLAAVAVTAAAATVFTAWAASQSTILRNPQLQEAWRPAFVATYAAAGLYLWQVRPASQTGRRVAGLALLYALTSLNAFSNPWLFAAGRLAVALFIAGMVYVFLAYPADRLATRERGPVAVLALALAAVWALTLLCSRTFPPSGALSACREPCPENPARVVGSTALGDVGRVGVTMVTALLLLLLVAGLIRKLGSRGPFRRYLFGPPLAAVIGLAISYAGYTVLVARGVGHPWPLALTTILFGIAVPIGLVGGQRWAIHLATGRLRHLMLDLSPSQITQATLQSTLQTTLEDPSLRFWSWSRSRSAFVDPSGAVLDRAVGLEAAETIVEPEGRPPGALTHDPTLQDLAPVPEALAATAVTLLDDASLREELRGARQRLAATSHAERVRLERDLHDGIQPRLTTLGVKLAEARGLAESPELQALLADAERSVAGLAADVRSLAHELYPPELHEEGLTAALRVAAGRSGATVDDRGIGALTPAVEEALYYTSLEAIHNSFVHGGDGAAITVTLSREPGDAVVEITDDGVGFDMAAARWGLGTINMRDRAGAVGGQVDVVSHPGDGTTVTVRVPLTGDAADGTARQRTVGLLLAAAERHRVAAGAHRRAAEFWESRGDAARVAGERAAAAAALSRAREARSSARALRGGLDAGVDGDDTMPVP